MTRGSNAQPRTNWCPGPRFPSRTAGSPASCDSRTCSSSSSVTQCPAAAAAAAATRAAGVHLRISLSTSSSSPNFLTFGPMIISVPLSLMAMRVRYTAWGGSEMKLDCGVDFHTLLPSHVLWNSCGSRYTTTLSSSWSSSVMLTWARRR